MSAVQSFGRYRVTSTLGAGAMGEVYAAVDEVLGREVAVKTLKGHRNGLAARILDERFKQEARAIASLAHPGVVQVFDIDLTADPPYLVMERVAGPSLKERLETGPLAVDELRALGIQIGRALAAAHAQRVIHRDVKPANILAAGPGTWKLADFGVAHIPDSSLTMTGQFVGSPAYAPPEALVKGQSDAEGDVYGLGATLYQAAAGRWPRLEDRSSALIPTVPPVAQLAPHLPAELCALIDRAIATDAAQRPTAAQIADALASAGPHLATPPAGVAIVAHGPGTTIGGPDASLPGVAISHAGMPTTDAGTPPAGVSIATPIAAATLTPAAGISVIGPSPTTERNPTWKRYAILGAAVLALIAIVAATRGNGTSGAPASLAAPAPLASPGANLPPGTYSFQPPPISDERQLHDWHDVVKQLDKGRYGEARDKLADWEEEYGATPETEALRRFLDEHAGREPRKKGKGKGRGRGD